MIRTWTPDEEAELIQLFRAGLSRAEIGQRIDRTTNAVQTRLSGLRRVGEALPRRSGVSAAAMARVQAADISQPRMGTLKSRLRPFKNPCVWWTPGAKTGAPA